MRMNYIEIAKNRLSEKRWNHTLRVIKYAEKLCKVYPCDFDKVELACLFHDTFREYGNLEHGPMAADFMEELGINDQDILNAVRFHTTGRRNMSLVEKVVFLADALEEGRDYEGVSRYRETSFVDLDKACLEVLEGTVRHLNRIGADIHKDTYEAIEYFKGEIYGN